MAATVQITPDEYDTLPPSIQKKYFSSVERLRILQQAASERRQKQSSPPRKQASSLEANRPPRPSTSQSSHTRPHFKNPEVPLLEDVNEDQALRFLALPDKIKRAHFNTEELVLLTHSSERVLRKLEQSRSPTSPTWSSTDRSTSVASTRSRESAPAGVEKGWHEEGMATFMRGDFILSEPNLLRNFSRRQNSVCSSYSMASSATDFHRSSTRKASFSRKHALAPLPLPPPTLLPIVPSTKAANIQPAVLPLPSPVMKEHISTSSPVEVWRETKPRYYGYFEARSKLRRFLASPEKFDEALEFGFPAADLYHDDDGDDDDHFSTSSSATTPRTPIDLSFATPHGSVDSGIVIPLHTKKSSANLRTLTPDLDGREMTLKLTLTRKDLRASDQQLYSLQRTQVSGVDIETSDPLALGSLVICDDHSGNHGAFAVRERPSKRGLKKLFSSMRKR